MALLSLDMIRQIRSVAEAYDSTESARLRRVAQGNPAPSAGKSARAIGAVRARSSRTL
jgi:hypothetical protein